MTQSKVKPGPIAIGPPKARTAVEKVVDFRPEIVQAPFMLRVGAACIDYILLVACPAILLLVSRLYGNDGAALLNSELNNLGWLLSLLLGFSNLIVLPIISGRSIGKFATGIRIVGLDGRMPSVGSMALRQTLGYLLVVGSAGLAFLTSVFSSKGRALHDYVAGTVVIFASKKPRV